ncbi:MAG TPA: 1,4-alpha-glucan branching protein GlgB [Candidatus Melainabacteria bacterium]|nr:1,4-alpha-glucan branching protein GlgB [Candidatus Melainabacteria bacterium]
MAAQETKEKQASFLTDFDVHLFAEGTHCRIYDKFGAHPVTIDGIKGTHFAVWAPNAAMVSVIGDFNNWDASKNQMEQTGSSGIWSAFIPELGEGTIYKYFIHSKVNDYRAEKSDPCGFAAEMRPKTASVVCDLSKHKWNDETWQKNRQKKNGLNAPISIYELHLGSWSRAEGNRWLTYRELAETLVPYVKEMGFTHVEFMPVAEHPLDASWGYQSTGYFAATSRYGTPDDLMYLIDQLHQNEIGVILDWVPAHFPRDGHGLGLFDGTHLYAHEDPRQGEHKEWGTYVFNFGRYEVANFLISNAMFWFDKYHIDGLRVDAVASMLYLDYNRKDGQWVSNEYGGRENIDAIKFLRNLNERVYSEFPYAMMIAEESTAWPSVTRPTYVGGLGFGFKWDMGWMNDTLKFMSFDPVYRRFHHNKLTFRGLYSSSENFMLPLSHDEVVHGKASLLNKMPGDIWQKFANLRLLLGSQWTISGKKLLFMGGEFGQWIEWDFDKSLDWHLLEYGTHQGVKNWVRDLNHLLVKEKALHELDCKESGFEWIDCQDSEQSVLCYMRKGVKASDVVLVVANFTPIVREDYRVGVPHKGFWQELLNSDATEYGGSGVGNYGGVWSEDWSKHGRDQSISLRLPPLSLIVLKAHIDDIVETEDKSSDSTKAIESKAQTSTPPQKSNSSATVKKTK